MALLEKHLIVKTSTIPGAGLGLFTTVDIAKGTRIVEYKGRITQWKEVKNDSTNMYLYTINPRHVIDARRTMKALARYANDAKGITRIKGITNNCVYINDGLRAFIESVKNIPAGAEILVDYGKPYWDVIRDNKKEEAKAKKEKGWLQKQQPTFSKPHVHICCIKNQTPLSEGFDRIRRLEGFKIFFSWTDALAFMELDGLH